MSTCLSAGLEACAQKHVSSVWPFCGTWHLVKNSACSAYGVVLVWDHKPGPMVLSAAHMPRLGLAHLLGMERLRPARAGCVRESSSVGLIRSAFCHDSGSLNPSSCFREFVIKVQDNRTQNIVSVVQCFGLHGMLRDSSAAYSSGLHRGP